MRGRVDRIGVSLKLMTVRVKKPTLGARPAGECRQVASGAVGRQTVLQDPEGARSKMIWPFLITGDKPWFTVIPCAPHWRALPQLS